ncbi:MAG: acetyl-CoA carboxylase biotin carboxylase subunit [Candidatus Melainabacteria bacterium]|nr:acetyl-CoA carboxylase biotin carboxylase subunit [Candidatus Melainabacteria bacterium]
MFQKVLIANRSEIAVRVIQACRELGIKTVAIFSEPDRESKHVKMADETWQLNGQPARVYLDGAQIIDIAKRAGADAIHPGYGFLSENAEFAKLCGEAGIKFIGPKPEVIHKMGSKIESRRVMEQAGVPVVPGTTDPVSTAAEVIALGEKYGYPIAIKASAGGGGRGLRVVRKAEDVEQALAGAQREGASYFGSGEVYVEKYLDHPRHIEVQILADESGKVLHLYERDCSSQRRHQKLLEETPAPHLSQDLRRRLTEAAVKGATALGYTSAGTVECMVSGEDFYFLEVNTRIQVEHPITEAITGIDIVKEQIKLAAGAPLSFSQEEVSQHGHAIECRINAEDPSRNFMPSPGTLTRFELPHHPWVRVDTACYQGYQVLPFYDSLLAKLVVWGRTRAEAIERTLCALKHFKIEGVATTIPFHLAMLEDQGFIEGKVYTTYVEQDFMKRSFKATAAPAPQTAAAVSPTGENKAPVRGEARNFEVDVNQKVFKVQVTELLEEKTTSKVATKPAKKSEHIHSHETGKIEATMHGLVKQIEVETGTRVKKGQRLAIFEAMKMESDIVADIDGAVQEIKVKAGQTVDNGTLLFVLAK